MICNNCGQEIEEAIDHIIPVDEITCRYSCSSKAKRSGVLQGCLPSATCSAPERSGGVEEAADYLRRSAPVERSGTWSSVLQFAERMEAKLAKNRHKGDATAIANECADVANFAMMVADWFLEHSKVPDSGQRSAPKAESVESDEGASGAQARNDQALPRGGAQEARE